VSLSSPCPHFFNTLSDRLGRKKPALELIRSDCLDLLSIKHAIRQHINYSRHYDEIAQKFIPSALTSEL